MTFLDADVTEINVNHHNLHEFVNGNYPSVRKIYWYANNPVNHVLRNFPNLEEFYCNCNDVNSLEGLLVCANLKYVRCSNNHLQTDYGSNINNCTNLEELDCVDNRLISLCDPSNCTNLRKIAANNGPKKLHVVADNQNLEAIWSDNVISDLSSRRLYRYSYLYNDTEIVHDSAIQKSIKDSIMNLLYDESPQISIENIYNSNLSSMAKEIIKDNCICEVFILNRCVTYGEVILYVWNRIQKSSHKLELEKILDEQLSDAYNNCFTGVLSRTISTLVGFYDDVYIEISNTSRISEIIVNCAKKIIPYDVYEHQKQATQLLLCAGYSDQQINAWVPYIYDPSIDSDSDYNYDYDYDYNYNYNYDYNYDSQLYID